MVENLDILKDAAQRAMGLRYDSPEAIAIINGPDDDGDKLDWYQYYPEADGFGNLTGDVIPNESDGYVVVHDEVMVDMNILPDSIYRIVIEYGWYGVPFPIWEEDPLPCICDGGHWDRTCPVNPVNVS